MHLISTDLPVPDPPITTIDVRGATSRSIPSSTSFAPNDLHNPRILIFGALIC